MQPFDIVKTRHQLNSGVNLSVTQTLRDLYLEGGFRRYYRGMTAELVGMVPKSSGMYATYEIVRRELSDNQGLGDTTLVSSVAGLASGVPEALIVTPFQVIKVRMQAKEHLGRYSSPIDCVQKTFRSEGVKSIYIGLGPTLWRNCVWNTVRNINIHFYLF